jgi:hypothetical protein
MRDLSEMPGRIRGKAVIELWGWEGDGTCGAFTFKSPVDRAEMKVIASCEGDWDHVSVSRNNRCPNWTEMEAVKRYFFNDDETAVQFHVPATDHINCHPACLHLWRFQGEFPRPPSIMVGVGDRPARNPDDAKRMMREAGL